MEKLVVVLGLLIFWVVFVVLWIFFYEPKQILERIKSAYEEKKKKLKEGLKNERGKITDIRSGLYTWPPISGLEKYFLIFLQFFRVISLSNIKYCLSDEKKTLYHIIEIYVISWFLLLVSLLFLHTWFPHVYFIVNIILLFTLLSVGIIFWWTAKSDHLSDLIVFLGLLVFLELLILGIVLGRYPEYFIIFIFGYLLSDILSSQLGIIFIDRYKRKGIRSLNRSIILIGINFLSIIVAFAIMYLETQSIGYSNCNNFLTSPIDALYFSAVTITSLGCSDMNPISIWGKVLVGLEPLIGLIIIVLVIGEFFTLYGEE